MVFSKGFAWIDDQFLVIEIAQSWVDGVDFYHWLPDADGNGTPKGFSFFYTGIHYLLFKFFSWIHFTDPQGKMYVVRLIHALWSMLIIVFGYRITLHYGNLKLAKTAGWILSVFWLLPFLSVRNMVEFVCIPFLMWAIWLIIKNEKNQFNWLHWVWIGVLLGMAFNIRYQTILITGGIGIALLIDKKWKASIFLSLGFLIIAGIIQGGIDYLVWKKPFIQFITYVSYNSTHSMEYRSGPWYQYILLLLGILIPLVSLFLVLGFLNSYRKMKLIFIPVLIFLIFHSWYPNKQERFIATIIPLLIVSGLVGWKYIEDGLLNPPTAKKIIRGSWIFFWVINFILLVPFTVMYSKKARVESMTYLSKYENLDYFIIEDVNKNVLRFPPQYYLGKWIDYYAMMERDNYEDFRKMKDWENPDNQPGFVLFFQPDNMESRVLKMKEVFPSLVFEVVIEPGFMDKLIHWLNPVNDNQRIYIYRNASVVNDYKPD